MKPILGALIILCCTIFAVGHARADEGHASLSCNGNLTGRPYSIYWDQYVYVKNDVIQNENHSFSVGGFLLGQAFVPNQIISGPFVIYQSADFYLAVPWKSNSYGVWIQPKVNVTNVRAVKGTSTGWIKLC